MSASANNNWRSEFGIVPNGPNAFFASKAELSTARAGVSQGHILRRAFDLLKLDGVLCTESTPLVYFKTVKRIEPEDVERLHRTFWNHGGAPVLVLVAPAEVQVYSGLVRPKAPGEPQDTPTGLVETLERASAGLREFLPAVESGEFFRRHAKSFDPARRVDRDLLNNLQATRDGLAAKRYGKTRHEGARRLAL